MRKKHCAQWTQPRAWNAHVGSERHESADELRHPHVEAVAARAEEVSFLKRFAVSRATWHSGTLLLA